MKLPPLHALRSFEAVARTGSVTRAAEELCISHSAVSHQIRKLEEWLGLLLVERSGRGIRLTDAGERYKAIVCEAFAAIHADTELLRKRKGAPLVRVSCLPLFAVSWLMPQMHDFWVKYPNVEVAIQYSRFSETMDPASVDVAVRHGILGDFPDFVAMPFFEGVTAPFASPDYLQRAAYRDLDDIRKLRLLHDDWKRNGWRKWLERARANGYDFAPSLADEGLVYPDAHLALGACLAGEGVALLPRELVLNQLRAKFLVPLSDIGIFEDKSYLVLTPRWRPSSRSALLFAQWMQSLPGSLRLGVPRS